ncbi:MAG: dephospho-CoA kinase [Chloroflexi bacterium]|nr:dephospho-CoA kinase [Chloroflexota bacterium]
MSQWPGKYVIGLTGNIATGKSVVRKMLEHLGAFGIDADGLSHQAMAKGGPAYNQVVQAFGQFILGSDDQIDRQALGNIVFSSPKALAKLEAIIHPIVRQAVNILAARAKQPVVVIEAIKLLEGELAALCDSVWVVSVPEEMQVVRLMQKRGMTIEQARLRIAAQSAQAEKMAKATIVIQNMGSFEDTWSQVQGAWNKLVPTAQKQKAEEAEAAPQATPARVGAAPAVAIRKGKPADAAAIANFINQTAKSSLTRADIMALFGQKAFVLAHVNNTLGALAGWQVENLVTRVDDLHLLNSVPPDVVIGPMLDTIEAASQELQSEAAFVFVQPDLGNGAKAAFAGAGYEPITADSISITAWREAVKESQPPGTMTMFKKLREDRVLRPV